MQRWNWMCSIVMKSFWCFLTCRLDVGTPAANLKCPRDLDQNGYHSTGKWSHPPHRSFNLRLGSRPWTCLHENPQEPTTITTWEFSRGAGNHFESAWSAVHGKTSLGIFGVCCCLRFVYRKGEGNHEVCLYIDFLYSLCRLRPSSHVLLWGPSVQPSVANRRRSQQYITCEASLGS